VYSQQMRAAPRQDLYLWDEPRRDRMGNQICNTLFFREGVGYTQDSTCFVLDADQESPAGSIRECDEGADHPVGRGQIALELESLTLGAGEQRERIPWSEIYSEELGKSSLPSNFPAEVRTIAYRSFS
jgi:hypothetical protein